MVSFVQGETHIHVLFTAANRQVMFLVVCRQGVKDAIEWVIARHGYLRIPRTSIVERAGGGAVGEAALDVLRATGRLSNIPDTHGTRVNISN
jgi:hypothetical protein